MPESSAVYQPTTVGYAYDNGRDPRITSGLRSSFSRLFSRHKFSSRKWLEWLLLSVSFCIFVAGLTELIVHLASDDDSTMNKAQDVITETIYKFALFTCIISVELKKKHFQGCHRSGKSGNSGKKSGIFFIKVIKKFNFIEVANDC